MLLRVTYHVLAAYSSAFWRHQPTVDTWIKQARPDTYDRRCPDQERRDTYSKPARWWGQQPVFRHMGAFGVTKRCLVGPDLLAAILQSIEREVRVRTPAHEDY